MVMCASALIEGGTGLSSPKKGGVRVLIEAHQGVWTLDWCRESQWERGSHKVEMTVPLTLAMAGG